MQVIRQTANMVRCDRQIRLVGIDDWAIKKGRNYGTIIIDLEWHEVIDVLPNRTAETVAKWLQAHPGIEVITRDRPPRLHQRYSSRSTAGIAGGRSVAFAIESQPNCIVLLSQLRRSCSDIVTH